MSHAHYARVSAFGPVIQAPCPAMSSLATAPALLLCLGIRCAGRACGRFWGEAASGLGCSCPGFRDCLLLRWMFQNLCQLQRAVEFNSPGISGGPQPSEALPGPLNQSRPPATRACSPSFGYPIVLYCSYVFNLSPW